MIGSPVPPPAARTDIQIPESENMPSKSKGKSNPPPSTLLPRSISFADSRLHRLVPGSDATTHDYSIRPALSGGKFEVPNTDSRLSQSIPQPSGGGRRSMDVRNLQNEVISMDGSTSHRGYSRSIRTNAAGDLTARQETQPRSSPDLLASHVEAVFQHSSEDVRVAKDKSVQTAQVEFISVTPEHNDVNMRAIIKSRSTCTSSAPYNATPIDVTLPLTPPPSSTSLPSLRGRPLTTTLHSTTASRKRVKKTKSTVVPHSTPIPNPDIIHLEIIDLEEMYDKELAFNQLSEMYKHQKFLREAEETFHRQKIADLTAGIMAQKMENLKLLQLLQQTGVTASEIQSVMGVTFDKPILSRETSADTLPSDEGPSLDPSRFAMLRKEEQFGRMCRFSSSNGSIPMFEEDENRRQVSSGDNTAPLLEVDHVKASSLGPPLTPAPSLPLPPVPQTRKGTHSMVITNSAPHILPVTRSRSLTEVSIPSIPYLDSFTIEQNMRRLEREFRDSLGKRYNTSVGSDDSSPTSDMLEFYEAQEDDDFALSSTSNNAQFSLIVQDDEGIVHDANTPETVSVEETDNRLCISSSLRLAISTLHSTEISNPDSSPPLSTEGSPDPNMEAGSIADSDASVIEYNGSIDHVRMRHTIFTNVPSIIATAPSSPRPASVDDSSWGGLLIGLVGRSDSRALSESDLERGEVGSVRSIEF